jgi:N-acylneuraminate cytidylyltransferase
MVTAIIPLKSQSVRCPNKNFRQFADTSLLKLKLDVLMKSKVDKVIINTESKEVIENARKMGYPLEYVLRDEYYTRCSGSEFFKNIAENCNSDYILYSPVTSPFITSDLIDKAIDLIGEYDSIVSVFDMKHHIWMNGKPLNYDPYNSPNSQDLPSVYRITYGIGLIERDKMIKNRNIIGDNPYFMELNEEEAIDIDTEMDFKFAEYVRNSLRNTTRVD